MSGDSYHTSYLNREIEAPWKPTVSSSVDLSNFAYRDDGLIPEANEESHIAWDDF